MAAVYSEKGGTLQGDIGVLSQENKEGTSNVGLPTPSKPKQIKAEDIGAFVDSRLGPATSKNHAEIVGMNAMPPIIIKEEQIEDEEYVQINLSDIAAGSEERASDNENESVQEANVDVKLRSMRCQDCGQQFTRWEAFKIHLRKHVEEEVERERTAKKRPLQLHNHNGEKKRRYEDDDEGEEVDVECEEEDEDEEEEEFFDSTCQIKSSEIATVRPRVAMLSEEEKPVYGGSNQVYACNVCGKVYSYLESFKNHQKTHCSTEVATPDLHHCPECGRVFKRALSLSVHMKVHRTPIPLHRTPIPDHCDQCNKSFHSTQTWQEHKELHKRKPFWCLSCTRAFKDADSLDKHLLGHDLKRHRCDICFKSFRVPAELRFHYNTHTGFKPYKCNFCDKGFSQLGNLITHRKRHLGVYKEGTSDLLAPKKSTSAGHRRVPVMKKLIVGSKGVVKTPEEFSQRANTERVEMKGSDSSSEDEYNEEGLRNNGNDEESESELSVSNDTGLGNVGNNREDSGSGSSASSDGESDSSEEEDEEEQEEEVERTCYGAAQREDRHYEEEEEEEEEVEFEGLVSQGTPQQQEGEWRCFECGSSFFQEPELHLHYMKHASGDL
ncbi:zinc finger protein 43 isoform X2 [Clupea harengus]|uniref:Zinc finger protein 43 isoform X2 n=1 Tax=Clupea harengus TaxID=7950 RepID=A0A6P3VJ79_CLUHA|nr:zinc finger protein 43 isoform X2 [Clupea harengus]